MGCCRSVECHDERLQTVRPAELGARWESQSMGRAVSRRYGIGQPRPLCRTTQSIGRQTGNARLKSVATGVVTACIHSAAMGSGAAATYEYEVAVGGEPAGVAVMQTSTPPVADRGVRTVDRTISIGTGQLHAIGFTFESVVSSEIGDSGLQRFDNRMRIEGQRHLVSASLETDGLVVAVSAEGDSFSKLFRRGDYDLTSEETPGSLLTEMGRERIVRVLDIDEQEIIRRTFVWIRNETLRIGSFAIPCKVVRFRGRGSKRMPMDRPRFAPRDSARGRRRRGWPLSARAHVDPVISPNGLLAAGASEGK